MQDEAHLQLYSKVIFVERNNLAYYKKKPLLEVSSSLKQVSVEKAKRRR